MRLRARRRLRDRLARCALAASLVVRAARRARGGPAHGAARHRRSRGLSTYAAAADRRPAAMRRIRSPPAATGRQAGIARPSTHRGPASSASAASGRPSVRAAPAQRLQRLATRRPTAAAAGAPAGDAASVAEPAGAWRCTVAATAAPRLAACTSSAPGDSTALVVGAGRARRSGHRRRPTAVRSLMVCLGGRRGRWSPRLGYAAGARQPAAAGRGRADRRGHRRRRPVPARPGAPPAHRGRAAGQLPQRDAGPDRGGVPARQESEEAARRSENRMRRFVADAWHELRTPLTSIRGYAELYRQGAVAASDEVAARDAAGSRTRPPGWALLVEDLLTAGPARPAAPAGARAGRPRRARRDAVHDARALDPDRPVRLGWPSPTTTRAASRRRHRRRGPAAPGASATWSPTPSRTPPPAPRSTVRLSRRDEAGRPRRVLEVADHGPGAAAASRRERVFERFYRADAVPQPRATAAPAWACPSSPPWSPRTAAASSWHRPRRRRDLPRPPTPATLTPVSSPEN